MCTCTRESFLEPPAASALSLSGVTPTTSYIYYMYVQSLRPFIFCTCIYLFPFLFVFCIFDHRIFVIRPKLKAKSHQCNNIHNPNIYISIYLYICVFIYMLILQTSLILYKHSMLFICN